MRAGHLASVCMRACMCACMCACACRGCPCHTPPYVPQKKIVHRDVPCAFIYMCIVCIYFVVGRKKEYTLFSCLMVDKAGSKYIIKVHPPTHTTHTHTLTHATHHSRTPHTTHARHTTHAHTLTHTLMHTLMHPLRTRSRTSTQSAIATN